MTNIKDQEVSLQILRESDPEFTELVHEYH